MYQPAHSRIIRFVLPEPDAPMMTMCRAHAAAGTANTGFHLQAIARIVPPTGMRLPRASSGTEPGALLRPSAAAVSRFHCRVSKVTGAEAIRAADPGHDGVASPRPQPRG